VGADNKLEMALNDPGKPWQNGWTRASTASFPDVCLSMEWFRNRTEAKVVIEQWRREYNEVWTHLSLAYRTPIEFKQQSLLCNQTGAILQ
jgi:putative transposase